MAASSRPPFPSYLVANLLILAPRSITKAPFTAVQAMVSMSLALNPSAFRTKSRRCLAEQVGLDQLTVRIGCDLVNDNGSFTLVSGDLQHKACADVHRGRHHRSEEHTSELQSLMRISYAVFCLQKTT